MVQEHFEKFRHFEDGFSTIEGGRVGGFGLMLAFSLALILTNSSCKVESHERGDTRESKGQSMWEIPSWSSFSLPFGSAPAKKEGLSAPGVAVLCYHQTYPGSDDFSGFNVQPDVFEKQLQMLKAGGYESVSLAELHLYLTGKAPVRFPRKAVVLTFDDGLTSHHSVVQPLLKKYGFTGVLFIYPTVISSGRKHYMTWEQLNELVKGGQFEIASHTLYHPKLPRMSPDNVRIQLNESRRILETNLGVKVQDLAYPFGLYDRDTINAVRESGYRMAFTVNMGTVAEGADLFTLNRFMVMGSHGLRQFEDNIGIISPVHASILPADGSRIAGGEEFVLDFPEATAESLKVKLAGHLIPLHQEQSRLLGRLPTLPARSYLPLTVHARSKTGEKLYRQFLYINKDVERIDRSGSSKVKKQKLSQGPNKRKARAENL